MTDNISSEECESDEERTEGPPPAKKLKLKCNLVVPQIQLPDHLSHVQGGGSQPSLVSCPDPTQRGEGLVTSGRFLGLH